MKIKLLLLSPALFLVLLTLITVGWKLLGGVDWSWWWVLFPLLLLLAIPAIILGPFFLVSFLGRHLNK